MKKRLRLAAILAAAFILSGSLPVYAAEKNQIPEEAVMEQESAEVPAEEIADHAEPSESATVSGNTTISGNDTDFPVPETVPSFHALFTERMGAYIVVGTLSDLTPDMAQIDTLYSLDGETWHVAFGGDWDLFNLDWDDESKVESRKSQACLLDLYEPLKSYIAGKIDYFYVKLRITKRNGVSFETQSGVIERGGVQPIPEGTERYAVFSSAILVSERDPSSPYRYRRYGRYQLTVPPDATGEEVAALLPDTLPVEVQLHRNPDFSAKGVVDCPVTWKPLSLPQLSPGEVVTLSDAAEEILVPAGALITTPVGIFQLDEPLSLDVPSYTNEVQLVLNVSQEDGNPTGMLWAGKTGLELSFHNKPTGAVSIKTYVMTEGESAWTELSEISLSEEFNQPSTANSGYALVLLNDQEPYRSYRAATEAKETPTPFFVGLKIEGGVYDGRELVLAWPDSYEELPNIKVGGIGGNEGNAGADNKDDSTESGQRPNLPQTPDDGKEEQLPNLPQTPDDGKEEQLPNPPQTPDDGKEEQQPNPPQTPNDGKEEQQPNPPQTPNDGKEEQQPNPPQASDDNPKKQQPNKAQGDRGQKQQHTLTYTSETASAIPENESIPSTEESVSGHLNENAILGQPDPIYQNVEASESGQRPNLPKAAQDIADLTSAQKASPAGQEERLKLAALAVETAAEIKNGEPAMVLSTVETTFEQSTKGGNHFPLLPIATSAIAVFFGIAAVCKAAGYNLFHRIAGKIRNVMHK